MSSVPLTQAVTSGDAGAVGALLANGANANERTSGGQTPLILATIFGHTHLIPLLLKAGADPHLRDNLGLNALDWAQRRGATEAIELFKKKPPEAPTISQTDVVERQRTSAAPPSREESDSARTVSEGEKSQRWLAGLKQRIAEQSQRDVPDGSNIFRAQPEPPPEPPAAQEPPPPTPAPVAEPEPVAPTLSAKSSRDEEIPLEPVTKLESKVADVVSRPKSTRKVCPKCGAVYNSELVAYCAHHVVELVDADEAPIISPPQKSSPALFWMIIVITLTGSIVVGSLVTTFLYSGKPPQSQTATSTTASPAVQKGTPALDRELENKAVSLPIAECPLNGQEAIPGTVVVRVVINKEGKVTSAHASGGDWLLRGAASEAALKSTFSPEKLRGRETEGTITYTFEP